MEFTVSLKKNYDFRRTYSRGVSAVSPYLVLYCRKNGKKYNRFGITTSKKLGHAVVRNKIRRRLRAIYRLNENRFSSGWDIVAVARYRCVNAEYSVIEGEFMNMARKAGVSS